MKALIHSTSFFICYATDECGELFRISFSFDANIEAFFIFHVGHNYIELKFVVKSPLTYLFAIEFFELMALKIIFIKFWRGF